MQRFIALSLAVHVLAIGGWYSRDIQPVAVSGARTLALTMLPRAPTTADSNLRARPAPDTLHTAHTTQQTATSAPDKIPLPEQRQTVPVPAAPAQQIPEHDSRMAAATSWSHPDIKETTAAGAASPAPASRPSAADDMQARHAVQTAVSMAFMASFHYPRIARRNGWEGTVILALRVLPDGQLTDILVSSSSGHPVLDRAAVHTLQTASVSGTEQWLNGQTIDLVIPVEYRLLDS